MKVWDQAKIELAIPGSAVRHVSAVRMLPKFIDFLSVCLVFIKSLNIFLKRLSFGSRKQRMHLRTETRVCIFPGPD